MKEHLKSYFPERFEETPSDGRRSLFSKSLNLLNSSTMAQTRQKLNCERMVKYVYENSAEIKLLAGAMKKHGCYFDLLRHTVCERCSKCHGGFDPDHNQIVICSNAYLTKNKILTTMMHEMIHMFDYCRAEFSFDNLEHVACSEIRAANLTYCSLTDRLQFGGTHFYDFKKTHGACVKDVAFRSVKAYSPETSDEKVWDVVDKVFPGCYNDLEPFGRRPLNGYRELRQSYRERFFYGYV